MRRARLVLAVLAAGWIAPERARLYGGYWPVDSIDSRSCLARAASRPLVAATGEPPAGAVSGYAGAGGEATSQGGASAGAAAAAIWGTSATRARSRGCGATTPRAGSGSASTANRKFVPGCGTNSRAVLASIEEHEP